jgi:hypothetical protein
MQWHIVTIDTIWEKAVELAWQLFATEKQLEKLRELQFLVNIEANRFDPLAESLLKVVLNSDESISMQLIQAKNGEIIEHGRWTVIQIYPDGSTALTSGAG